MNQCAGTLIYVTDTQNGASVVRPKTAATLRLERLVAHRELQLLRAGAVRRTNHGSKRGHIDERQRKLDQARRLLAREHGRT